MKRCNKCRSTYIDLKIEYTVYDSVNRLLFCNCGNSEDEIAAEHNYLHFRKSVKHVHQNSDNTYHMDENPIMINSEIVEADMDVICLALPRKRGHEVKRIIRYYA